ncbi:16S rRNA (guanine(966)-N(2))-methyltransferase RsmD [Oecophyllibacter saccharovorans]|uniref:RsmD family RNA methyltransferase n=1 Tax=Oecophyllibacter saccharovorans TaxID=2558360 RepID=UPI001143D863|nr:RsmD family RNA methyltransferase [Oecophyllibacter saccharovorans]QDH14882.1 16S rRNA (guanine(966)-N(2))-methyltransferase RsmD [Oecophyllibacter saccharovorans]
MRIIGGSEKGRRLSVPKGDRTRPTADRTRQALFDMLIHAPWFGREKLEQALVLDGFAGTGALGLEALSRGAPRAVFMEKSRPGLAVLWDNIRSCHMEERVRVLPCDTTRPPRARETAQLVFLDPPYGRDLVRKGARALSHMDWISPQSVIVAETENTPEGFQLPGAELLAARPSGAALLTVWTQYRPEGQTGP